MTKKIIVTKKIITPERLHWAPHVRAQYEERTFDEDGMPETQIVEMWCEHPGCDKGKSYHRVPCTSGAVRQHIVNFAIVHYHKDPFEIPRKA